MYLSQINAQTHSLVFLCVSVLDLASDRIRGSVFFFFRTHTHTLQYAVLILVVKWIGTIVSVKRAKNATEIELYIKYARWMKQKAKKKEKKKRYMYERKTAKRRENMKRSMIAVAEKRNQSVSQSVSNSSNNNNAIRTVDFCFDLILHMSLMQPMSLSLTFVNNHVLFHCIVWVFVWCDLRRSVRVCARRVQYMYPNTWICSI